MTSETTLKKQLVNHLFGGEAFLKVDQMLKKIPFEALGRRPKDLPYSFYEIFFHIWYTQRDILKYCKDPGYAAPSWPDDYWPKKEHPESEQDWTNLKNSFFEDREKLKELVLSTGTSLSDTVPSGGNHTIFREILLVIEHTAYHSGQLLILLRHLGLHSS